jgi:hypothetical protein
MVSDCLGINMLGEEHTICEAVLEEQRVLGHKETTLFRGNTRTLAVWVF